MIAEIGLPFKTIPFTQPRRIQGIAKNNFYTLYDLAMLHANLSIAAAAGGLPDLPGARERLRRHNIVHKLLFGITFQ